MMQCCALALFTAVWLAAITKLWSQRVQRRSDCGVCTCVCVHDVGEGRGGMCIQSPYWEGDHWRCGLAAESLQSGRRLASVHSASRQASPARWGRAAGADGPRGLSACSSACPSKGYKESEDPVCKVKTAEISAHFPLYTVRNCLNKCFILVSSKLNTI